MALLTGRKQHRDFSQNYTNMLLQHCTEHDMRCKQAESWNASAATKQTGLLDFPLDAEEDESVPRTSLDLLSVCQWNLKKPAS